MTLLNIEVRHPKIHNGAWCTVEQVETQGQDLTLILVPNEDAQAEGHIPSAVFFTVSPRPPLGELLRIKHLQDAGFEVETGCE